MHILVSMHEFGEPEFPPFLSFSSPGDLCLYSLFPLISCICCQKSIFNCSWWLLRKTRALVPELDPIKKKFIIGVGACEVHDRNSWRESNNY
jgi:hypothetical protein